MIVQDVDLTKKLIAHKDLKVFVQMEEEKACCNILRDNKYKMCELNSFVWKPEDKCEVEVGHKSIKFDRCVKSYAFGWHTFVEAIIPKGTEYVINRDLETIYSSNLYITNNTHILPHDFKTTMESTNEEKYDLFKPLLDEISNNGVSCGWLVKSDKTFISPLEYDKSMEDDIIGIVGFVKDDIAYVMALQDRLRCFSMIDHYCNKMLENECDKYNDYNGKLYTEKSKDKLDKYYGFKYCLEYQTKGTEQGDWYLPSVGEIYKGVVYNYTKIELIEWLNLFKFSTFSEKGFMTSYENEKGEYIRMTEQFRANPARKFIAAFVRPFLQIKFSAKYIGK